MRTRPTTPTGDENGLFAASAYPSLAARERELIAGVLDLLHAPDGAGGSTTAGGTESILMAMKAARDWAREHRPGFRRTPRSWCRKRRMPPSTRARSGSA